ncbi:hypothetical protein MGG_15616 [Pyricularia oryzae 70-15]|uniref:Uncharacterized protein n=3 Tax=Pyricularia oryzae TaxID=318829 RepID=G4MW22_PYRO7|nr:uncharacterized protein MGG_15616 [Pyricularia oryzae 70-15]EHA54175.1 hypothetical protein MGG_15616 [Pyricularia oryzae 70-15]ELQ40684.1 hypothetical protein OOU_Y34scaffold00393g6 [Pyricularia oryzae Y34]
MFTMIVTGTKSSVSGMRNCVVTCCYDQDWYRHDWARMREVSGTQARINQEARTKDRKREHEVTW